MLSADFPIQLPIISVGIIIIILGIFIVILDAKGGKYNIISILFIIGGCLGIFLFIVVVLWLRIQ